MAREIVVWCDLCLEQDERVAGRELPPIGITLGNRAMFKPRVLAVCDGHEKELNEDLLEPLKQFLTDFGQIPEGETVVGSEENKRKVRCIVPDCSSRPFKNKATMQGHVRNQHGLQWREALAKYGEGEEAEQMQRELKLDQEQEPFTVECDQDDCDVAYSFPEYSRPIQALAVHKSAKHGIRGQKSQKKQGEGKLSA